MTSPPAITVVIPSYQGASRLPMVLEAFRPQIKPGDELLVIDDCSTDDTAVVARGHGATVHTLPVNSGVGTARNEGVRRAGNEIIVLFDDDVLPSNDYLDITRRIFSDEDMMICQGTHAIDPPSAHPDLWQQVEAIMGHHAHSTKWVKDGRCSTLNSTAFCVRRSFIMNMGLFREDFKGAGGEEYELAGRILMNHYIAYRPKLVYFHEVKSFWPRLKAIFGRARLYTRIFSGQTSQDQAIFIDKVRFVVAWGMLAALGAGLFDARLAWALIPLGVSFVGLNASILRNMVRWKRSKLIPALLILRVIQLWVIGLGMFVGAIKGQFEDRPETLSSGPAGIKQSEKGN